MYQNDQFVQGKRIYQNGTVDEGRFQEGKLVQGKRTFPDGTFKEGVFYFQ